MGKFTGIEESVFSVFAAQAWRDESITTVPSNFPGDASLIEFVRVSVIPSGPGVNAKSSSGVVVADIFTKAGDGPKRSSTIADRLDSFLSNRSIRLQPDAGVVQFGASSLGSGGLDSDNPTLFRVSCTVPFNYFEVM